jgi:DNA-binding NtrC family response regulator
MSSPNAPLRILVVDDESIIADTLVMILCARGFDARAIYSGEDAAELARAWSPNFVVTDIIMGKMDGIALAIQLTHTMPLCKVLLMSGQNAAGELMAEAKKNGHEFPILAKPFHPESLFECITQADA